MRKKGRPSRLSFDLDLYNTTHMHGSAFNKGHGIALGTQLGAGGHLRNFWHLYLAGLETWFPCSGFGATSTRFLPSYTTKDGAISPTKHSYRLLTSSAFYLCYEAFGVSTITLNSTSLLMLSLEENILATRRSGFRHSEL